MCAEMNPGTNGTTGTSGQDAPADAALRCGVADRDRPYAEGSRVQSNGGGDEKIAERPDPSGELCARSPRPATGFSDPEGHWPLFHQPWWLDAVAPGSWGAVTVVRGGELQARLPFVVRHRRVLGLKVLTSLCTPRHTPWLGPWLRATTAKAAREHARQKDLMEELIAQLPPFDVFHQGFAPDMRNWLPFHWRGFKAEARITYVLDHCDDLGGVWSGLKENIRRQIRKAERTLVVRDDLGVDAFVEVARQSFDRQDKAHPFEDGSLHRAVEAGAPRDATRVLIAEDASGSRHAAGLFARDEQCWFYIAGGTSNEGRTTGAHSLVMWEAIKIASRQGRSFDFEGSMIETIERYFRAFGGRQAIRLVVTGLSRRSRIAMNARELVRALLIRRR